MRVHFIIHEAFEAPGAIETWAIRNGYETGYSRVYAGDALPQDCRALDMLVVMGGPQSPATTKAECPHFDSPAEQALIRQAVMKGKAVLGVCLGAQLLGESLGASFERSPEPEIGKFPIRLTEAGLNDPLLHHFGKALDVGHWHGDMPGLTERSSVLAFSKGCPRQIVKYGPMAYGFQCHLELTPELVEALIANSTKELAQAGKHIFVEDAVALRSHDFHAMNETLMRFLDAFAGAHRNTRTP